MTRDTVTSVPAVCVGAVAVTVDPVAEYEPAGSVPKSMPVTDVRFEPSMVTVVPDGPVTGEREVTVGAGTVGAGGWGGPV